MAVGFVSKHEDELERRGGQANSALPRRIQDALDGLGCSVGAFTKSPISFDDAAESKLDKLLGDLDAAFAARAAAFDKVKTDAKAGDKALKAHALVAQRADELVLFLVPFVRQMSGARRRHWARIVEQIKNFRFLM